MAEREREREREREKERERVCINLSLSQRDGVELVSTETLVLGKLEQPGHGVSSRREDKQERNTAVGVGVATSQVEWRRLDKLLTQMLADKGCHQWNHLREYWQR